MLKALFIGGTGIISSGITRALAENADWELTILNRGKRAMEVPENVRVWTGDIDNAVLHKEPLVYEETKVQQRSYK